MLPIGLVNLFVSHQLSKNETTSVFVGAALILLGIFLSTTLVFIRPIRKGFIKLSDKMYNTFTKKHLPLGLHRLDQATNKVVLVIKKHPLKILFCFLLLIIDWVFSIATLWVCFVALRTHIRLNVLLSGFSIGFGFGFFVNGSWWLRHSGSVNVGHLFAFGNLL